MAKFSQKKTLDFVLIGRITIDFNPLDYYNDLSNLEQFQKYIGGSTGNTAIGLNRLKNKVVLVSKISADGFGVTIQNFLKKEKMVLEHIYVDPNKQTGLTFTEMLSPNHSEILMYRHDCADLALNPSEISAELLAKAKILVVSGTALSTSPSREAVLKAVLLAKQFQTEIVFDIDFRNYNWKSEAETQIYYQLVAQLADVIIGSKQEFYLCSNFCLLNDSQEFLTAEALANYWLKTAKLIIIKDGKNGSELFNRTQHYSVGIIPVKMLKSFGGGDAYAAYFLHHYLKDPNDLTTALSYSSAAASYMVQSHSSFNHPSYEALTAWMGEHVKKLQQPLVVVEPWIWKGNN